MPVFIHEAQSEEQAHGDAATEKSWIAVTEKSWVVLEQCSNAEMTSPPCSEADSWSECSDVLSTDTLEDI